jgi:Icc protein
MRVIQITDLHLFSDREESLPEHPGRPTHASLAAVLDHIEAHAGDFDALVVSGDIAANSGCEPLDELAYSHLRKELERRGGAALLARTHVIPGNHDCRASLLKHFPACQADQMGPKTEVSFAASVAAASGSEEWRLVGLDSGGKKERPEIGPSQMQRLREELDNSRHQGKPTLLFMHHPPVAVGAYFDTPHPADPVSVLDYTPWQTPTDIPSNPEALAAAAAAGGRVKAIVCGHVHWEGTGQLGGTPVLTSPATCCQYMAKAKDHDAWMVTAHPPGYRVIESVAGEPGRVQSRVVWVTDEWAEMREEPQEQVQDYEQEHERRREVHQLVS